MLTILRALDGYFYPKEEPAERRYQAGPVTVIDRTNQLATVQHFGGQDDTHCRVYLNGKSPDSALGLFDNCQQIILEKIDGLIRIETSDSSGQVNTFWISTEDYCPEIPQLKVFVVAMLALGVWYGISHPS